jgi:Ca2+/H+ antiporter
MLKIAFTLFVCSMYADTVLLVAAVATGVLALEGHAATEPVFSIALQVTLSLVCAMVLRRQLYGVDNALWALWSWLNNDDVGHSFERTAATIVLYVCCLIYTRETATTKFPIGIYGCVLLVGVVLWAFDVFVQLRRAHDDHVGRHEDDGSGRIGRRHRHSIPMEEFRSIPVLLVAVLVAFADIILSDSRWAPAIFAVGTAIGIAILRGALGMLLDK